MSLSGLSASSVGSRVAGSLWPMLCDCETPLLSASKGDGLEGLPALDSLPLVRDGCAPGCVMV